MHLHARRADEPTAERMSYPGQQTLAGHTASTCRRRVRDVDNANPSGCEPIEQTPKYPHPASRRNVLEHDLGVDQVELTRDPGQLVIGENELDVVEFCVCTVLAGFGQHALGDVQANRDLGELCERDQDSADATPEVEGTGRHEVRHQLLLDHVEDATEVRAARSVELRLSLGGEIGRTEPFVADHPKVRVFVSEALPVSVGSAVKHRLEPRPTTILAVRQTDDAVSTTIARPPEPGWYRARIQLDGDDPEDESTVVLRFFADEDTPVHIVQRFVPRTRWGVSRIVHVPVHTRRVDVEVHGDVDASIRDVSFQSLPGPTGPILSLVDLVASSVGRGRAGFAELAGLRTPLSHGGLAAVRAHLAVSYERLQHRRATALEHQRWRARNVDLTPPMADAWRATLEEIRPPAGWPTISVVAGVHDPDPGHLRSMIDSVRRQLHDAWELCLVDDASTDAAVRAVLDEAGEDPRVSIVRAEKNGGISAATNRAIAEATGEWIVFVDHDDLLEPFALAVVAVAGLDADVVYTDEDKVEATSTGERWSAPHFKPPWNPELLLGQNYLSHLTAIRRTIVEEVGGLRAEYDGAQDWDLLLRVTSSVPFDRIAHVPLVTYSWRKTAGSTALSIDEKPAIGEVGRRVLVDHLGPSWSVREVAPTGYEVQPPAPPDWPSVSVVIPTRDRADLLTVSVAGLHATDYGDLEVIIADNDSSEAATHEFLDQFAERDGQRVVRCPGPFNFSDICNRAVDASGGDVIVLLNNDIEVIDPQWLKAMVRWLVRDGVGVVGAKLMYADRTIQHAGVILGLGGVAGHHHLHEPTRRHGYHNRLRLTHEAGAVTGACLATHRAAWNRVGGLDPELGVAFNDIDYCVRVRETLGLRTLWTPTAELVHHESLSRGPEDDPEKVARYVTEATRFHERWSAAFASDPAHSPNLSLEGDAFAATPHPRLDPLTWSRRRPPLTA